MKVDVFTNNPDRNADIPKTWDQPDMLTNKIPGTDAENAGFSDKLKPVHIKQADAVDVRETSTKAVDGTSCGDDELSEERLREIYSIPEGEEVTPFQRLFGGLANNLHNIVQRARPVSLVKSESRGKSPAAAARSQMLKMIMPELSREQGDKLAAAIQNRDGATVERIMKQIGKKLGDKLKVKGRKKG